MSLFAKNVTHFKFFTNEMECERCNQVIVLNATTILIFQYKNISIFKNVRKTSFKKYYTIGLIQLLERQICKGNR